MIGDIHGQVYDLIYLFEKKRRPGDSHLLFLGDYVDRGLYSVEVLLLLLAIKICYPSKITLLRGNHESRQVVEHFTFREECLRKYDDEVFELCIQAFDAMSLAAEIGGQYLCVHGGLSPELESAASVDAIQRF